MKGRKRHGGRRANRGTQPVGPFAHRVTRAGREAIRSALVSALARTSGIVEAPTLLPDGSIVLTFDLQGGNMRDARAFFDALRARGDVFVPPFNLSDASKVAIESATTRAATGDAAPILARYDREISHARSRGHVVTAERIEAERDEYREAGQ